MTTIPVPTFATYEEVDAGLNERSRQIAAFNTSRAGEFNRIAEAPNGAMIMAIGNQNVFWTKDRDMALRITSDGRAQIKAMLPMVGFRSILAG